jgi:hypothetical protein
MQNPTSPYETKKINNANGPALKMDTRGQENIKRQQELETKAPPTLMFPLETLMQFVGNMIVTITQARTALNVAGSNPDADKKVLGRIVDKLDKVNLILITIPEELEKLKL